MRKLKLWHKTILIYLVAAFLIYAFGSRKQFIGFIIVFLVLTLTIYIIEKKKKLSQWQARIITYLIVVPIFYFLIPSGDLLALFAGSIIAWLIISLLERRKERGEDEEKREKEMLPEWEGEEDGEKITAGKLKTK